MAVKPNILLLLTDQHHLSACGCYGETVCRTANLDRLAAGGVRFENAYTSCPICSPARATIMTGQMPHRHGINRNIHELGCSVHELEDRPHLLSRRLEAAGYRCGYSGKWHLGTDKTSTRWDTRNTPVLPRDVGFVGHNIPGHGNGGFDTAAYREYLEAHGWALAIDEPFRGMGTYADTMPAEATVPHFLVENTIGLLQRFREADAPFFMWHNFWGPHAPYFAPKEYLDLYRRVAIPPWPHYEFGARATPGPHHGKLHPFGGKFTWRHWEECLRHYYAFAHFIDDQIGRLLTWMEEAGLLENTHILFAADHGESLGAHGGMTDKMFRHFEEVQRIPCIVRLPGITEAQAGTVREELVSLADLYPTICDLAGAGYEEKKVHGASLVSLLEGKTADWRDMVVVEETTGVTLRTVRRGRWKYGYTLAGEDCLYDLEDDPHEMHNRIHDPACAQVRHELEERLYQWMGRYGDFARERYVEVRGANHPEWLAGMPSLLGAAVPGGVPLWEAEPGEDAGR